MYPSGFTLNNETLTDTTKGQNLDMELKTWELLLEQILNIKIKFVDNMKFIHVNTQCTQFHFSLVVVTIISACSKPEIRNPYAKIKLQ